MNTRLTMPSFLTKIYTLVAKRSSQNGPIADHLPGLSKGHQTMMKPISNERVEWLQERAKVVNECARVAQHQMYSLTSGGAQRDDLTNALREFNAERVAIAIE